MSFYTFLLSVLVFISPFQPYSFVSAQTIDDINFYTLYTQKGVEGLKPYVRDLSDSVFAILGDCTGENRYLGEYNGERVGDFLEQLAKIAETGDMNAKDALIKAMCCPNIGGLMIGRGLMGLGPKVLPEIVSHLDDEKWEYKYSTIQYLKIMARFDTTGAYFTKESRETIRIKLVAILTERAHNNKSLTYQAVGALAYFGNETDIPLLEEISKEGKPGHVPEPRAPISEYTPQEARDAIAKLREKK
jgi:hypothetical protein